MERERSEVAHTSYELMWIKYWKEMDLGLWRTVTLCIVLC